jgi:DNA polymerase III epsilon subunit-like protein
MQHVLYVVFDLETTGFSKERHEIIEIAAQILAPDGRIVDDVFKSFIKPHNPIPAIISELTGIRNEDVEGAAEFKTTATNFFEFITGKTTLFESENDTAIHDIILVAHNGKRFDIPFLLSAMDRYQLTNLWSGDRRFRLAIDTMELSKKTVQSVGQIAIPTSYSLGKLYQYVTGQTLDSAHQAENDVQATVKVLKHGPFWQNRKSCLFSFRMTSVASVASVASGAQTTIAPITAMAYDSDSSDSSSNSTGNNNDDNAMMLQEEPQVTVAAGDVWERGIDFIPTCIAVPWIHNQPVMTTTQHTR